MKRRWILLGYGVPYAFLALWGDAAHGTMLLYLLMAAAFFLLCNAAVKQRNLPVILCGNLVSTALSCLCMVLFGPQDMGAYFKPFTGWSLLLIVSALAVGVQMIYARHRIRRHQ
ncbi:MAG: hypothetical protein IJA83_03160 [Clostridia bacterium]|nr:hypothetical protein [Clostridia bacterium]